MPDRMPGRVPVRMSGRMLGHVPGHMPGRMPDHVPVRMHLIAGLVTGLYTCLVADLAEATFPVDEYERHLHGGANEKDFPNFCTLPKIRKVFFRCARSPNRMRDPLYTST